MEATKPDLAAAYPVQGIDGFEGLHDKLTSTLRRL